MDFYTQNHAEADSKRNLAAKSARRHIIITAEYHQLMQEKKHRLVSIATALSMTFTPLLAVSTVQYYA